jgi:5'-3' exonuclease
MLKQPIHLVCIATLQLTNIDRVKEGICDELETKTESKVPVNWIDEFIALSIFLENNVLPAIPALQLRYGSFSRLIDTYVLVFKRLNSKTIVHRKTRQLNRRFMIEMLQSIAKIENAHFQNNYKAQRFLTGQAPGHLSGFEKAHYEYLNLANIKNKLGPVQLGKSGWKERYYRFYFNIENETDKNSVHKICKCYLEGMAWLLEYYRGGVTNWSWYYPFHKAPHLSDLLTTFKTVNINSISHQRNPKTHNPLSQLVALLPPKSYKLLPSSYQQLVTDPESPLADIFPSSFEEDFFQKQCRSEGTPRIPFVDMGRISEVVDKLPLNQEEQRRNCVHSKSPRLSKNKGHAVHKPKRHRRRRKNK